VKRRDFVLLLAGAMIAARALRAQQQKAMPVIGWLSIGSREFDDPVRLTGFRQGLGDTGYVEGRNIAIEYRWAEGQYDRLPALAADLVGLPVAVIAAVGGPPPVLAAKVRPQQSRSFSSSALTRSNSESSPASTGRVATSRG